MDYSLDDCKRLRERLEEKALAAYTSFTGGMESAEVPFVEMQLAHVEGLARRAQAMGGDLIRIFAAYERDGGPPGGRKLRDVDNGTDDSGPPTGQGDEPANH